jgi:hypothetical protein
MEARRRYDAGMGFEEAAHDIDWRAFQDWKDSERVLVNVEQCYREFAKDASPRDPIGLFTLMARWRKSKRHGRT